MCYIERAFNIHSMYDSKIDLSDRIHTFEAMNIKNRTIPCCAVDSNVPDIIHAEINEAIMQIKDHLLNVTKVELKNGTFYFKFNKKDKLYLIYAAGIQAVSLVANDGE